MNLRLNLSMNTLLREVAAKHEIDVNSLIGDDGAWHLESDVREALTDAISSEFAATGLTSDSEPNARGLLLEKLLDRINSANLSAR